jgi:uncharacterized protein
MAHINTADPTSRAGVSQMEQPTKEAPATTPAAAKKKKIWIDLDNSPHVPFFLPIIAELRNRGYTVLLTARNSYQVCELLDFHHISCRVIGSHWGKNRFLKILGTFVRAGRLVPTVLSEKPDLAISHGSRAQLLAGSALGIPTVAILDYEFTAHSRFLKPDWIFSPQYVPDSSTQPAKRQLFKYPGLKEDIYVPGFQPDPSLRNQLGLGAEDLVVTVRPPATEAHYHNPEAEVLLEAALSLLTQKPAVRLILLPRNKRQQKELRQRWGKWIDARKIVIPEQVVDGLNLIWLSDLVISGGGTMNREAAALGVPVYSIFRGRIGGVDKYLAESGRLVLIESPEEIGTKIVLERRPSVDSNFLDHKPALEAVVNGITSIAEHQCL